MRKKWLVFLALILVALVPVFGEMAPVAAAIIDNGSSAFSVNGVELTADEQGAILGGAPRGVLVEKTAGGYSYGNLYGGQYNDGSGHFTMEASVMAGVKYCLKPSADIGINFTSGKLYTSASWLCFSVICEFGYKYTH